MKLLDNIKDRLQGKVPKGKSRSNEWPKIRKQHLKKEPNCAVCNGNDNLNVHHILPFHLHPRLELDPKNLITLCESKHGGVNCHLWFGHLGDFKNRFNLTVKHDAKVWLQKSKKFRK